jgi:hypothetical protein
LILGSKKFGYASVIGYVLIDQGIEACNELLLQLMSHPEYKLEAVRNRLGVDPKTNRKIAAEIISGIIGGTSGRQPVSMGSLQKFFERAIIKIHEQENLTSIRKYNSIYPPIQDVLNYYRGGRGSGVINIPEGSKGWVEQRVDTSKIVELLDCLDCSAQQDGFTTALEENRYFYNFPVIAHANIPQNWLLRRLMLILKQKFQQPLKTLVINLGIDCPDYSDLINTLRTDATKTLEEEEVVRNYCNSNSLNVLIFRNYSGMGHVSDNFLEKLLEQYRLRTDVCQHPNLMIFWVGENYPLNERGETYPLELFTNLPALDTISLTDINEWVTDSSRSYGDYMAKVCTEKALRTGGKPLVVLVEICKQLEVSGGIKEINGKWKI